MYNLFRKDSDPPTICAVPDGGSLPSFLRGPGWSFEGKAADIADRLTDVDLPLYEAVVRETGYYVFVP